jgi:hypothetical protein
MNQCKGGKQTGTAPYFVGLNTAPFQQCAHRFGMCETEGAEHDKGVMLVDVERRIAESRVKCGEWVSHTCEQQILHGAKEQIGYWPSLCGRIALNGIARAYPTYA